MVFNATRYGFSGGNLNEGFQGRPDLQIYTQAIKESQNFYSGQDGVMRFRKGFELEHNAAPFYDSGNQSFGACKTISWWHNGTNPGRYFADFCKDTGTGKYTAVFFRREGYGYHPEGMGMAVSWRTINTITVGGEVTLNAVIPVELHRIGTFVVLSGGRIYMIKSVTQGVLNKITLVNSDGSALTGAITFALGDPIRFCGYVLTTPLEPDFDWTTVEEGVFMIDGATRVWFYSAPGASSEVYKQENYAITNSPFPAGDYPSKVLMYQERLVYSGFASNPRLIAMSRAPDAAGAVRYNDFTIGTSVADAVVVFMAPNGLAVTSVKWLEKRGKNILVGVTGGLVAITSIGNFITSTDIDVTVFSVRDTAEIKPMILENTVQWVGGDRRGIYESKYSFEYNTDFAYSISEGYDFRANILEIVSFSGSFEGMFVRLENNTLVFGIRSSENRFSFFPIAIDTLSGLTGGVTLNGLYGYISEAGFVVGINTYFPFIFPIGKLLVNDMLKYNYGQLRSELFEYQNATNDQVLTLYNGLLKSFMDYGVSYKLTAKSFMGGSYTFLISSPGNSGYDIKITHGGTPDIFDGKRIFIPELGIIVEWKAVAGPGSFYADYVMEDATLGTYNLSGSINLTGSIDNIYVDFTTGTVSSNSLPRYATVPVVTTAVKAVIDGEQASLTVGNTGLGYYTFTLDEPAFFVHIGYDYKGKFTMLPLAPSGSAQLGLNRPKILAELKLNLLYSGDGQICINREAPKIISFEDDWFLGWRRYFHGTYRQAPESGWNEKTEITFLQKEPQPFNISLVDIFEDVSND